MYLLYIYKIETNKLKKECYLIRQDNTIYIFSIKIYFSSTGQLKTIDIVSTKTAVLSVLGPYIFNGILSTVLPVAHINLLI